MVFEEIKRVIKATSSFCPLSREQTTNGLREGGVGLIFKVSTQGRTCINMSKSIRTVASAPPIL